MALGNQMSMKSLEPVLGRTYTLLHPRQGGDDADMTGYRVTHFANSHLILGSDPSTLDESGRYR
jgi:hypothetical protein